MKRSKWMVLLTAALLLFGPIFAASPDCKSVFDPPPNAHNKEEVRMTITDRLEAAFTRTLTGPSVSVQLTLLAGEKSDGCKFKLNVMDPASGTGRCVFDISIGPGTVYYAGQPLSSDKVKIEVRSNSPNPAGMYIDTRKVDQPSDDCFKTSVNAFKLKLEGVTGDCSGSNLWVEKGYSYEELKIKDQPCEVPTPATVPPTTAGPTGESTPGSPTGGSNPTDNPIPSESGATPPTGPIPGPNDNTTPGPNDNTTPGGSPGPPGGSPTSTAEPSEFPPWAIAVIVVGAILLLVLVAVLIYCFCCRKKSDDDDAEPDAEAGEGGEAAAAPEGEATALEADAPEEDAKTAEELPENDANPAGEKTALGATPDDAQGTQDSEEQQKTQSNKEDDQPPAEDAK